MLFSSISFLYYFLPLVLALYFAAPKRLRNAILLLSSLFFYFYGEPKYVVLLLVSSAVDFTVGHVVDKHRGTKKAKYALISSIVVNLGILLFFKYSDFFIANINALLGTGIPLLKIPLPLGVSFFTFQTMSYTIDLYRGEAKLQRNPLSFATYVTMFPQLVAGPIVRYQTISEQLHDRVHSLENFSAGAGRFVIGLGKKVLIANALGQLNEVALTATNQSVLMYWMAIISFMLQIYFDFSGYSDMALGLGKIFGFTFLENFNYPFISRNVSEFWRRWHISMGTWFREYVYIPLGGNRVSRLKWVRNIAIVWFCTGFWHGAAWNFVAWGVFFGILLAIEKLVLLKLLDKLPRAVGHIYCLLVVTVSFVIFHLETLSGIMSHIKGMFGFAGLPAVSYDAVYYLDSYKIILLVSIIGATPLLKNILGKLSSHFVMKNVVDALSPVYTAAMLIAVTAYLIDSSFNPFLYFRF